VTDESKIFAFPLETVPTHQLSNYLKDYCDKNDVEGFAVGIPKRTDNTDTHSTPHVEGFIRRLEKLFPAKSVYRVDERFTSSIAKQSLIDSGVKKSERRDKSLVDKVSATLILQSWIEGNDR